MATQQYKENDLEDSINDFYIANINAYNQGADVAFSNFLLPLQFVAKNVLNALHVMTNKIL